MKKTNTGATIVRLMGFSKKYIVLFAVTVICAIIYVAGSLLIPVFVGQAIDCAIDAGRVDFKAIFDLLIKIGIATGAAAIAQYIMNLANNRISAGTVCALRRAAFDKLQSLPFSYLDGRASGDIVSSVTSDAEQVGDGLLTGFTQLFTGIATIIATLVIMFIESPIIALVVLVLTPLSMVVAKVVSSKTYKFFKEQARVRGEQTAYADEMIRGQKTVRTFSRAKKTQEEFDALNKKLQNVSLKATFWSSLTNPTTRFVNNIVYAIVALVGAMTALVNPAFTVGTLTCMLSYANQYTKPFNEISGVITELQGAAAAAERVFSLIDETPETYDGENEILGVAQGDISFDNISFSYVPEKPLIENFSLDIKSGMKVAIVGPTGCGKTTLINLLMRFYDTKSGDISVDGKKIRELTRHSLRENFGMVLQDTWIMPGTVRENIAIGKPDATDEEIVAAAKNAHAHGFISRLPQGYDTVVSGAESLSGGERQLLCIARVMLKDPPILILDEATSSVDTRTEQRISRCFDDMTKDRTSFVVAHRLSTVKNADLILVMRDGNIVESGNHDELIERGGFYKQLYESGINPKETAV
ncbi:MAG: ABC transporter ATP-binding protein [Ruminococcaceae bacterium]|nr:ABC transporter ATP-binding protein [Oscillospiraceae bacterium]